MACSVCTEAGESGAACAAALNSTPIAMNAATIYFITLDPNTPFLGNLLNIERTLKEGKYIT
jgi:hypothetical protein